MTTTALIHGSTPSAIAHRGGERRPAAPAGTVTLTVNSAVAPGAIGSVLVHSTPVTSHVQPMAGGVTAVINVSYLGTLDAMLRCGPSPSGTFRVTLASETANVAVILRAGSMLRYRALN